MRDLTTPALGAPPLLNLGGEPSRTPLLIQEGCPKGGVVVGDLGVGEEPDDALLAFLQWSEKIAARRFSV